MSITVFVKTETGVHKNVDVSGKDTMGSLYRKAANAADLLEGRFKLVWEEKALSRFGDGEVQGSGLIEGAVIHILPGTIVGLTELKKDSEKKLELERLVAADPELVLEIDVGDSPDNEVCLWEQDLPFELRRLVVTDSTYRTRGIGNDFLRSSTLASVELKLELSSIGSHFLCRSSVSYINFGDAGFFSNVTSIGDSFLTQCSRLQNVDLSGFTSVTSIGHSFLLSCPALQNVDLNVFMNVTSIGHSFLSFCAGLQNVDLKVFSNLASIPHGFLSYCSGLQNVDLHGFANVTTIGNCFLAGCSGLQNVDLHGFTNVNSIDDNFLSMCSELQNVDLSGFASVKSVGCGFMAYCTALKNIKSPSLPEDHALVVALCTIENYPGEKPTKSAGVC